MVAICPQILTSATCNDLSCAFNHNVTTCEPCRKVFDSALVYRQHLSTTEHGAAVRIGSSTGWLYCSLCNAHPCGVGSWNAHIRSNRHTRKAKAKGISPAIDPESVDEVPNHKFCATCNRQIPNGAWERHVVNEKHLAKESYASFTAVLEEAEADRHGVAVTGEFDFGVVEVAEASVGVTKRNRIAATVTSSNVRLVEARLSSSKGRNSTPTPFTISTSSARVSMRIPIALNITAKQAYAGREEDRLELVFEDTQLQAQFIIVKTLRLIVGNKAQYEALQPSLPYAPKRRSKRHPEKEVEPGVKAPSLGVVPYVVTLPKADIPETLKLRLQTGNVKEITAKLKDLFLPKQFNEETYSKHFRNLLWVEEFRMSADLEHYDVSDAVLTKHNQFYYVNVPGLAEKRPSVLVGDSILVRRATAAEGHWFEGIVHVVRKEEVGLRFGGRFHTPPSVSAERFTMRFKLNRYPLRRQHQALTTAFAPKRLLFPVQVPEATPNGPRHAAFNTLIDQNQRQRLAVDSIVRLPGGSAPFVVFGPPGTGKTVTIVEAIRQLLVQNPKARILACAPSNSAADLIALRLLPLGQRNLFRFYAPSRPKNAVPDDLEAFTYKSQDHFSCPPPSQVAQYKVCISTCVSASVFFGVGVPRGHFTHIFIDEAGQATEPEAMIAIKTMADNKTNVVLSGDPKQLGPVIRSAIARDLGLEISYIERLMRMGAYHPEGGHGKCVVKLTQNFRSHPAILKFPNEKFYNNDLVACGSTQEINTFVKSAFLPEKGKKFPIVFVGMSGKDDREASSPSFFNIQEALMVKEKVQQLRGDRKLRLSDADIGIITPYHAQVRKIRKVLLNYADEIKVGSVEEFQGQERKVIIISTVRSSREYVEYDLRHTLGFVASPRRFNVAVTRAKALLIVIGDPLVLSLDPLWRQFLNYIHKNGGWTGKSISWDPNAPVDEAGGYDRAIREAAEKDMNDFTRQMESMTLDGLVDDSDYVDVNIDRPWNRDAE